MSAALPPPPPLSLPPVLEQPRETWPLVAIVGPTASGKTGLALALAERLPAEIINVDSMQVFRSLDVGSDKPTQAMRARVPFHLVDVVDPGEPMDAATFASRADEAIAGILGRGRVPLAAGGTGLYHRALRQGLVEGPGRDDALREALRKERDAHGVEAMHARLAEVDPATAAKLHPRDWVRIERALEIHTLTGKPLGALHAAHGGRTAPQRYRSVVIGCARPRAELHARIEQRLGEMWRGGLIEETQALLEAGFTLETLPLKALGYAHAARMLSGELSSEQALELAVRDTRRFARRQLTWFRAEPQTVWLALDALDDNAQARLASAIVDFACDPAATQLSTSGLPLADSV